MPASVDRAVLLVDALVRAFDARGFTLQAGTGERRRESAQILIEGELVGLLIEETAHRRHHKPTPEELAQQKRRGYGAIPKYDYVASGVISIKRHRYETGWRDLARRKVEDRLNEVMIGLIQAAFDSRQRKQDAADEALRRRIEEARREDLRRKRDAEARAVAKLRRDAEDWRSAALIRDYIAATEREGGDFPDDEARRRWISWALDQASRLDPLSPSPASILDIDPHQLLRPGEWEFEDEDD